MNDDFLDWVDVVQQLKSAYAEESWDAIEEIITTLERNMMEWDAVTDDEE